MLDQGAAVGTNYFTSTKTRGIMATHNNSAFGACGFSVAQMSDSFSNQKVIRISLFNSLKSLSPIYLY